MSLVFEPGYYAKVRIDDEGNIVDVSQLEEADLPQHSHSISDLNQDELINTIADLLSNFFVNTDDTVVKFSYDRNTKTVKADLNLDDETVFKNEYGQLSSAGGGGTVSETAVDTTYVDTAISKLSNNITDTIISQLRELFVNNEQSSVVFNYDSNTKTFSADLRYDGISIVKDENGDLIATGKTPGDGGGCATHTHTVSQIEDFEQAVINIFNDYSKNLNIDLSTLIDGTTIKINENGQLTAVRTALEKHTHLLEDIIDYVAPDPAAVQLMSALGEDVDYSTGVINFESLNIGYSILALSQYLKDVVNVRLDNLQKQISNINVSKDNTGFSLLSIHKDAIHNTLYDKLGSFVRDVYYAPSLYLSLDFIPFYTSGTICLYRGSKKVAEADLENLSAKGDSVDRFTVEYSYQKKSFLAKVLKIDIHDLLTSEGSFEFRVSFVVDNNEDFVNRVNFYSTPNNEITYKFTDVSETHELLGKKYYNSPKKLVGQISIENYENYRFVPNDPRFVNGIFTSVFEDSKTINLLNLFGTTQLECNFKYTAEISDCWLYNHCEVILNGEIINNQLVPKADYVVGRFIIPDSQFYNSVKISGIDDIKNVTIEKGTLTASGQDYANTSTKQTGLIDGLFEDSQVLTFLDNYDNGRDSIVLSIKTGIAIDLSKIEITCLNLEV